MLTASPLVVGSAVSVVLSEGVPPFTVEFAGRSVHKPSRSFAFMEVPSGRHVLTARDGQSQVTEVEVVVP